MPKGRKPGWNAANTQVQRELQRQQLLLSECTTNDNGYTIHRILIDHHGAFPCVCDEVMIIYDIDGVRKA